MHKNVTIRVITEKRSDAIGVYNKALIASLRNQVANVEETQVNNHRFKHSFLNFMLEIINTLRIVRMVQRNEILLFTDPLSFNLLAALLLKNKKYVIFYHYEKDPFFYKYIPFVDYKGIFDRFDGVIGISRFSLSQLRLAGSETKKCTVVYCGLDHDLFKPVRSKPYPFDYILSVGTEEPRKNMENVLKAFQLLKKDFPGLKLVKVGRANPKNRQMTLSWIEKLNLTEDVIFTNFVDEQELPSLYSGAKLLLFPSLLEGFGFPVVEALACGCPVVTSNRDPMQELVGTLGNTADPLRAKALAQACYKILSDNGYRRTLRQKGLVRARDFSWEKATTAIYDYLRENQDHR